VQIGDRLHLSPRTVEKHVSSLLRKIDANNRAELVRYAIEHHLVQ
jgi:DNA-binding NarL/FixJ family response regulator